MTKQRRLEVVIAGDAKSLQAALGKAGGALGSWGSKLGGVAKGAVAAVGAAFAVDQIVDFGGQLLSTGAQLTTWRTKVATVFEAQAAGVRQWADANNEAFGLTDDQLAGLAASFGDLLKPMGFTASEAAGMSKDVVGLAGALSAWTGGQISAAEVSEILSAAMLGERDALQQLGISISQAEIDAILLAKGQDKLTGSARQQAEAIATQELLFQKSTDAQKAWAAGGNEALEAQNKLKSVIAEAKERLATGLLPVLIAVTTFLSDRFGPVVSEVAGGIGAFIAAFRDPGGGITSGGLAGQLEGWGIKAREIFDQVSAKVREWWPTIRAAFVDLAARARETFDQIAAKVREWWPRVQAILAGVVAWFRENWPQIRQITLDLLARIHETWVAVFGAVQAVVETVVKIVTDLWARFGEDLVARLQGAAAGLFQVINGVYLFLTGIFNLIKAVLTGEWGAAWEAIKQILAGAWIAILGALKGAWQMVLAMFQVGLGTVSAVWSFAWNAAKTLLTDILAGIKSAISSALDKIVGFVTGLPGRISDAARGMWNGLSAGLGGVIASIARQLNKLIRAFNALPGPNIPLLPEGGGSRALGSGTGTSGGGGSLRMHSGGVVPGVLGQEVPVIARAGERFRTDPTSPLNTSQGGHRDGPLIGQLIIQGGDPQRTARAAVDEIAWRWRIAG